MEEEKKGFWVNLFKEKNKKEVKQEELKKIQEIEIKQTEKVRKFETKIVPTYVNGFDNLIEDKGLEQGSTILISGGAGTGKTTFAIQSLYNAVLNGEKAAYLSFEEDPIKIKAHMKKNYDWDLEELEKQGKLVFIKIDPLKIARKIEGQIVQQQLGEQIEIEKLKFPFNPNRIVVDSLSALSITFEEEQNYRRYIIHLFEELENYNALIFALAETEQTPTVYSRSGVEEFLVDGVIVFYNIKKGNHRKKFVEILKLRSSNHQRELFEMKMTKNGIKIVDSEKVKF